MAIKYKKLPSFNELSSRLEYDCESGHLYWKKTTSQNSKIGQKAGRLNSVNGYYEVCVMGIRYRAHRLAWLLFYGQDPVNMQIDHMNGDRQDNRICNLRLATNSLNNAAKNTKRGTSGARGVIWHPQSEKWRARIQVNGKRIHLGCYQRKEEAMLAYQKAAIKYFGDFAENCESVS